MTVLLRTLLCAGVLAPTPGKAQNAVGLREDGALLRGSLISIGALQHGTPPKSKIEDNVDGFLMAVSNIAADTATPGIASAEKRLYLVPDDFKQNGDGDDDAPSIRRALAALATAGATDLEFLAHSYHLNTPILQTNQARWRCRGWNEGTNVGGTIGAASAGDGTNFLIGANFAGATTAPVTIKNPTAVGSSVQDCAFWEPRQPVPPNSNDVDVTADPENVGNGTIPIALPGLNAIMGNYRVTFTNGREFEVTDPERKMVGSFLVGSGPISTGSQSSPIQFEIKPGSRSFAPGDSFSLAVKWVPTRYPPVIRVEGTSGNVELRHIYMPGVWAGISGDGAGRLVVDGFYGQCFAQCVQDVHDYDLAQFTRFEIWTFWSAANAAVQWSQGVTDALYLGRVDTPFIDHIFVYGVHAGLHLDQSRSGNAYAPGGPASKVTLGMLSCDHTLWCLWSTGAGNTLQAATVLAEGASFPDPKIGTTVVPLPRAAAVEVDGAGTLFAQIGRLWSEVTDDYVIGLFNQSAGSHLQIGSQYADLTYEAPGGVIYWGSKLSSGSNYIELGAPMMIIKPEKHPITNSSTIVVSQPLMSRVR